MNWNERIVLIVVLVIACLSLAQRFSDMRRISAIEHRLDTAETVKP